MSHSKHTFKNQKSTKAPDMPNLNARFLSISLSKDDQDWQSVLHIRIILQRSSMC